MISSETYSKLIVCKRERGRGLLPANGDRELLGSTNHGTITGKTLFNATIDVCFGKGFRSRCKHAYFLSTSCNSCFKALSYKSESVYPFGRIIHLDFLFKFTYHFLSLLTFILGVRTGNLAPSISQTAAITSFASASCSCTIEIYDNQDQRFLGKHAHKLERKVYTKKESYLRNPFG